VPFDSVAIVAVKGKRDELMDS